MAKTILIVDNDETIVAFLRLLFEEKGFAVHTAHDGTEGLALARRVKPAVIVSDMMMGRMHGFELLREIRADPELARTVVIGMSAKSYKPDIERAKELGATEYLVKPFRTEELLALVERHLPPSGPG